MPAYGVCRRDGFWLLPREDGVPATKADHWTEIPTFAFASAPEAKKAKLRAAKRLILGIVEEEDAV